MIMSQEMIQKSLLYPLKKGPMTFDECEGRDSNPRTAARLGPEPSSFDLARIPSRHYRLSLHPIKS